MRRADHAPIAIAAASSRSDAQPLLVRLPNWVGDVCMALPALRALEAAGFAPTLAGRRWAADLLAGHGWPVIALPAGPPAAARALRDAGAPRRGLLLTNSLGSALALRLAGVSALGHRGEGRSPLLGRAISRPGALHEAEVFWRLAARAVEWLGRGDLPPSPPAELGLRLTDAHRAAARDALARAGLDARARYAVVAPLATGTIAGQDKAWRGFDALERALRDAGLATVCCPGPGEDEAARIATPGAMRLRGLGLGAYAAVCEGARVTVANDSGPMHLAAAVGAPVVGVFGPSDPRRTGPWGGRAIALGGRGAWPDLREVERTAIEFARLPDRVT
jgi:heptosyltransferase-2